jgi:hypothetical protein
MRRNPAAGIRSAGSEARRRCGGSAARPPNRRLMFQRCSSAFTRRASWRSGVTRQPVLPGVSRQWRRIRAAVTACSCMLRVSTSSTPVIAAVILAAALALESVSRQRCAVSAGPHQLACQPAAGSPAPRRVRSPHASGTEVLQQLLHRMLRMGGARPRASSPRPSPGRGRGERRRHWEAARSISASVAGGEDRAGGACGDEGKLSVRVNGRAVPPRAAGSASAAPAGQSPCAIRRWGYFSRAMARNSRMASRWRADSMP